MVCGMLGGMDDYSISTTSVESNRDLLLRAKTAVKIERYLPDQLSQRLRSDLQEAVDVLDLLAQYTYTRRRWQGDPGPSGRYAAETLDRLETILAEYGVKPPGGS